MCSIFLAQTAFLFFRWLSTWIKNSRQRKQFSPEETGQREKIQSYPYPHPVFLSLPPCLLPPSPPSWSCSSTTISSSYLPLLLPFSSSPRHFFSFFASCSFVWFLSTSSLLLLPLLLSFVLHFFISLSLSIWIVFFSPPHHFPTSCLAGGSPPWDANPKGLALAFWVCRKSPLVSIPPN